MFINLYSVKYYCKPHILIPRGHAHSFWSAPGNMTSGKVQHQTSVIHRLPITLHKLRVKSDSLIGREYEMITVHMLAKLDISRGRNSWR